MTPVCARSFSTVTGFRSAPAPASSPAPAGAADGARSLSSATAAAALAALDPAARQGAPTTSPPTAGRKATAEYSPVSM